MPTPRVHTPAGKSRFAPFSHTPHPPPPPPPPLPPPAPSSSSSSSCGGKVRVVARVRPFLPSEVEGKPPQACISVCKGHGLDQEDTLHIQDPRTSREGSYKVDSCYVGEEDITVIFAKEVEPLLPALFRGCNATVFAYGATGSGKTYTMQGLQNHPGLMPLVLESILTMSENSDFRVEVSYYEVYMDRCYDLLQPRAAEISVLEGSDGTVQLRGLSQMHVKSLDKFQELFMNGCKRRKFGQTGLNDASSRSHGVLLVMVTGLANASSVGKLNLIDLAGNEDNRRTGNEGVRLAESARINQSLFALSNVINALNSNEPRVPYRDSKLTRILQDSLGGTSQAIMIACLNPRSYQEAAHTLSLAARSRQIMNHSTDKRSDPTIKVDMEAKLQDWLEARGKAPSVSPSPLKTKPLFYTPSRHHINRIRQFERDASKVTMTPRRVHVPHHAQNVVEEAIKRDQATLTTSDPVPSKHQGTNEYRNTRESSELPPSQAAVPEECCPPPSEKENFSCGMLAFTPCAKVVGKSSSPPLSERLQNLRTAMKEILQPTSNILPATESCCKCEVPRELPNTKQLSFSPAATSPAKTPTATTMSESARGTGTPLEKFSKNGSGIKNSMVKEYLEFLNTASREELLELKGIGDKRAAYILELREECCEPFKELEDLERIGISKKQAVSIFSDTARRIFFTD